MSMKTNTVSITIDCTQVQRADDGNTTYYGGVYKVNDQVYQASGNDRQFTGWQHELMDRVVALCPHTDFTKEQVMDSLNDAVHCHDQDRYVLIASEDRLVIEPIA